MNHLTDEEIAKILIKDNGEELVDIEKACPGVIVKFDDKSAQRQKPALIRKTVVEMLNKAKSCLPERFTFIIRDAWRSPEVQKQIKTSFIRRFTKKYPDWSEEKVIKEVGKYVAPFSGERVSGHMTGAALDLGLAKDGKKVPTESKKLSYQENSQSHQPKLPNYIQKNRKIIFGALQKAGFVNYHHEWWHWSYGDQYWAAVLNKPNAIYGAINE